MFLFFVVFRFYSKLIFKLSLIFNSKDRRLHFLQPLLEKPFDIEVFEFEYNAISGYALKSSVGELKKYSKKVSYIELLLLHRYYNIALNVSHSICLYHEIIRRNLLFSSFFRPFGFRRFLATHVQLGGIGFFNIFNEKYSYQIIWLLCFISNFDANKKYNNYIRNKSVSLCGGAPSPKDNSADVLKNEVVVRLNKSKANDDITDVVYFRSERLRYLSSNDEFGALKGVGSWLSIKTFKYYFKLRYVYNFKRISPTTSLDAAFEYGKLNAIPTVALDLVSKSSGKIYIFDTDLNLSKSHKVGYRDSGLPSVNFNQIFGDHPSYIQFLVLSYLHKKGYVEFERNPNFCIEWSYTSFLRQFSKVYCKLQ